MRINKNGNVKMGMKEFFLHNRTKDELQGICDVVGLSHAKKGADALRAKLKNRPYRTLVRALQSTQDA